MPTPKFANPCWPQPATPTRVRTKADEMDEMVARAFKTIVKHYGTKEAFEAAIEEYYHTGGTGIPVPTRKRVRTAAK